MNITTARQWIALKNELPATLKLALPLIFTQLLNFSLPFIDTLMAGHYDDLTLASVALAAQIFSLIFLFMAGCSLAVTSSISQAHGRDDRQLIRRHFQQGFWLMTLLGLVALVATVISAFIPTLIGSDPAIASRAREYLLALSIGSAFLVIGFTGRCFVEGMGAPRLAITIQALMIPLNIIGNYLFLYVFDMGARGMAISTVIGFVTYTGLIFFAISRSAAFRKYHLFSAFSLPDWRMIRQYFAHGLPIALTLVMEGGLFIVVGLIVSRTGAINTAANQIALNYAGMSFMIPLGLAGALTVRCGNAYGRSDFPTLRARGVGGILTAMTIMIFMATFAIILRHQIPLIYTENQDVIAIASGILLIVGLFQISDGIQVCAAGILRGMHDNRAPMGYAFIGYWVIGFPAALLFSYGFNWQIKGLWVGMAVGLSINAFLGVRRVLMMTNKKLIKSKN